MSPLVDLTTPTPPPNISDAITALLAAIEPLVDADQTTQRVIDAWGNLSFDDRRYLGNAYPALVTALIDLENLR